MIANFLMAVTKKLILRNSLNNMDKVEKFFDEKAKTWDRSDDHSLLIKEQLIDNAQIVKGDHVLDIGCGTGVITELLFNRSQEDVDAIDLSSEMINIAKMKFLNNEKLHFIHKNFLEYFPNKKYDKLIVYNAYPHFLDLDKFIKHCHELLNNNGVLLIIHSLSRKELNSHHKAHALKVSRLLDDVEKESKKFIEYFDIIKSLEDDEKIIMLFKAK